MRAKLSSIALVLSLVLGVAACAAGAGRGTLSATPTAQVFDPPQLSEVIQLSITRVVGGEPLSGALVVSNPGGTINLNPTGCRPDYVVVLTIGDVPPEVAWPLTCDVQPFLIPHGTTRLPISVSTTYSRCVQPGGTAPGFLPCSASRPPPLPPGVYAAVLEWQRPVPLPPAQPVVVTVMAKSS